MDPLKMAYGVKKPLEHKVDKIKELYDNQKRYYPIDKAGDIDEWGAVEKHRMEVFQREEDDKRIKAAINKKEYANELEREIAHKKARDALDRGNKEYDRIYMFRSQE